jgi:hypothetical protein
MKRMIEFDKSHVGLQRCNGVSRRSESKTMKA